MTGARGPWSGSAALRTPAKVRHHGGMGRQQDGVTGENPRFGELFAEGRAAVLGGSPTVQAPPVTGGSRWGMSVVLRPEGQVLSALDDVTREAMSYAGDGQWPTGTARSSHLTVRALEPHREEVPADDVRATRYREALVRAARRAGPVRFRLTGLTLTPSSVMLCAEPIGDPPGVLAAALADELGDAGWFEAEFRRDIWYANLVHFAGPLRDAAALVAWVRARRHRALGVSVHTYAQLAVWRFDGRQCVPEVLGEARLG